MQTVTNTGFIVDELGIVSFSGGIKPLLFFLEIIDGLEGADDFNGIENGAEKGIAIPILSKKHIDHSFLDFLRCMSLL